MGTGGTDPSQLTQRFTHVALAEACLNLWVRRVLLATALVVAGSCGGSPVSPDQTPATVPTPRPVVLDSGLYTLSLTLAPAGIPVCQNGICTSVTLCIDKPASTTTSFEVDLERSGETATVRVAGGASSLVLTLRVASAFVTGTIAGSARDANGLLVDVSGSLSGAAPWTGAIAVSGNIDGHMSIAGGSCSNNGHAWSLTPR
jgi:hypothetical protein